MQHVERRSFYGLRRQATDLAPEFAQDARVLNHLTGHAESRTRERIYQDPHNERVRVDVVGPICETGDFLALDREMELPKPGELLSIMTVGAYGFSMSSQYNQRPRPAEVMVSGDEATLVRRRETVDDLVAAEMDL